MNKKGDIYAAPDNPVKGLRGKRPERYSNLSEVLAGGKAKRKKMFFDGFMGLLIMLIAADFFFGFVTEFLSQEIIGGILFVLGLLLFLRGWRGREVTFKGVPA